MIISTTINYRRLKRLGISYEQYIICDLLEQYSRGKERASKNLFKKLIVEFGFEDNAPVKDLIGRGIIFMYEVDKIEDTIFIRLTDTWNLKRDIKADFEEMWTNYGLKQNKANAWKMYQRCINKGIEPEHLKERLTLYKAWLKSTGTYQQHMASWLNPENERFEDDYTIIKQKEKNAAEISRKTIKQAKPSTR